MNNKVSVYFRPAMKDFLRSRGCSNNSKFMANSLELLGTLFQAAMPDMTAEDLALLLPIYENVDLTEIPLKPNIVKDILTFHEAVAIESLPPEYKDLTMQILDFSIPQQYALLDFVRLEKNKKTFLESGDLK